MKVLTQGDGNILTLALNVFTAPGHTLDGKLVGLDGETATDKGIVGEVAEPTVKRMVTAATKRPAYEYMEAKDFMRDLRFLNKALADVENGTEVGVIAKGRGVTLDIPQDAKPDYTAGLKVGAKVAVGPQISPKALMNAHGTVTKMNGKKAAVRIEDGDLDRIRRATGKRWAAEVNFHLTSLEVIA